jgi:hypothetical protein
MMQSCRPDGALGAGFGPHRLCYEIGTRRAQNGIVRETALKDRRENTGSLTSVSIQSTENPTAPGNKTIHAILLRVRLSILQHWTKKV